MTRARGMDVSKYDKPIYLFKATIPVDFVIQRLAYGTRMDEAYLDNKAAIQPILIRGAYHYFSTAVPWVDQADKFLDLSKDYHFLMEDYEKGYNNLNLDTAIEYHLMLDYLIAQSHKKVLNYTNPDIYDNFLAPYYDFSGYDLHIAQYPWSASLKVDTAQPKLPKTNKIWKMWQYGADAFGTAGYGQASKYGIFGESSVDLIVFNGTKEELMSYVGNVTGTVVNPAPVITNPAYIVLVDALNVRDNANGNVIGVLYKSNIVHGIVVKLPNGAMWLKMDSGYACIQGASGTKYMQDVSVNIGGSGY